VSDLPAYPQDAAEREAEQARPVGERQYASWGRRVGAYLLDSLILIVPLVVLMVLLAYLATLIVPFVYFTFFHGDPGGQTPGKRMLVIRVVGDETGDSIGYGRAFGRYAITFVFWIFFLPGILDYLWPLWDAKNQALHDKVVGSIVVRA
jgi:uncharacterized RDD family membrane protein YckC